MNIEYRRENFTQEKNEEDQDFVQRESHLVQISLLKQGLPFTGSLRLAV